MYYIFLNIFFIRIFMFSDWVKNTNLEEDFENFLPIEFGQVQLSSCSTDVDNVSANQRPGRTSLFSDWSKTHKLCDGFWILAFSKDSSNSVQWLKKGCKQGAKRATYHTPEYNLLPWPGRPSWFSDQSEKQKPGRGRCNLAFYHVSFQCRQQMDRQIDGHTDIINPKVGITAIWPKTEVCIAFTW